MLNVFLILAFVLGAPVSQTQGNSGVQSTSDPSKMSLAERAAAARKAAADKANRSESSRPDGPPPLTPEQRGTVRDNAYVNDFLHFRVALTHWQPFTDERAARAEDTGRRMVNPDGQSTPYRVLWIGDSAGRNVALTVMPIPPNQTRDLKQINEIMKKVAIQQLALAKDISLSDEPFLLGDAAHAFAGSRITSTLQGKHLVQSQQLTLINGFLVNFTITGDSDQDVTDALRSFKASLAWTPSGQ
jgi:hypothetical protein